MSPAIDRPDPPYLQIVNHIRKQILSGELRDGDTVASIRQIAQEWNVATATAVKALSTLRADGLVVGVTGKGTVVRAAEGIGHSPMDRPLSVRKTGRIYPSNSHAKITAAELAAAPDHVANALGLTPGAQVIRRHRVTYQDEAPVSASTSWLDGALADIAPLLLIPERIVQGTMGYIEELTGRTLRSGRDQLAASAATEENAADLKVAVGSPVLRRWLIVNDTDGNTIEYGESAMVPERRVSYDYQID